MKTNLIEHDGWTLRIRMPELPGPYPVVFLFHGWQGTEDVMWVFAKQLPENALIIAPRAPYQAASGYSWVDERSAGLSSIEKFNSVIKPLTELAHSLDQLYFGDFSRLHLMGFSQGAATCFAWAAAHPEQILSIAGLAGFVPEGIENLLEPDTLKNVPVFMAHGNRDATVPITAMRSGANYIEQAGARLTICEDNVGHKLSANCMRGLGTYYEKIFSTKTSAD